MKFIDSLAFVRRSDSAVAECVTVVAEHVLFQWHTHGNKTPYNQMLLAINGGVDTAGLFGEKNATIRGVSKALALAFSGIKLGKQDKNADIPELVKAATGKGMQTKVEAREAAAAKKAAREAAKAEAPAGELENVVGALVLMSGAAIKLTAEECHALEATLKALRSQTHDIIDAETSVVAEAAILIAA